MRTSATIRAAHNICYNYRLALVVKRHEKKQNERKGKKQKKKEKKEKNERTDKKDGKGRIEIQKKKPKEKQTQERKFAPSVLLSPVTFYPCA